MNKNIAIGILAAAIIFLLWVLLSDGCGKPVDSHTDDYQEVKAERDSAIARELASRNREDSLRLSIRMQDTLIADLVAAQEQSRIELDRSKNQAYRLAVELQAYKREHDTSAFGRKLDSLLHEVIGLTDKLTEYESIVDSLQRQYADQQITYQTLLDEKATLYSRLRESYDNVSRQYDHLYHDYGSQGKSLKREKLKGKIAALLALVATGLLILK